MSEKAELHIVITDDEQDQPQPAPQPAAPAASLPPPPEPIKPTPIPPPDQPAKRPWYESGHITESSGMPPGGTPPPSSPPPPDDDGLDDPIAYYRQLQQAAEQQKATQSLIDAEREYADALTEIARKEMEREAKEKELSNALDEAISKFDQDRTSHVFFDDELTEASQKLAEQLNLETEERADQQKEQYDAHMKALDEQAKQLKLDQEQRERQQRFAALPEAQPASFMDTMGEALSQHGTRLGVIAGLAGMPRLAKMMSGFGLIAEGLKSQKDIDRKREEDRIARLPEVQPTTEKPTHHVVPTQQTPHSQQALGGAANIAAGLGIAGLAPPLMIAQGALMVKEAVEGQIKDIGESWRKAMVELPGQLAKNVAALDPRGTAVTGLQAAEQAGETLSKTVPILGEVVNQEIQMFTAATRAGMEFHDALRATAEALTDFSPALMLADAQTDITRLQGDFRRGALLGDDLADFMRASTRLDQAGKDALAEAIKPILPRFVRFMEALADVTENVIAPAVERVSKTADRALTHAEIMAQVFIAINPFIVPVLQGALRFFNMQKDKEDDIPDFLDAVVNGQWGVPQGGAENRAREQWWRAEAREQRGVPAMPNLPLPFPFP